MRLASHPVVLACALAVCAASAQAQVKTFAQALAYATGLSPETSDFNPANALARIERRQANAELRLDLAAGAGPCKASARLRGRYQRGGHTQSHAAFLNQGGLRCAAAGGDVELAAGREILQWGSSFFLSPSNPFFLDTGKTNPIQELVGKDMLQASWFPEAGLTLSAIRNWRHSAQEPDKANFSPLSALRVDWVGDGASGGAIVSRRDDGVRRLGMYGTLPYSRALLLYAELNLGRGNGGWFAEPDPGSPIGWRMARSRLGDTRLQRTMLAGAGYTFESGWTLNAEWIEGNEGYGAAERAAVNSAAGAAARAFPSPHSAQLLGTALSPNLPYLGSNYLFLQLLRSEWQDKGDVALRWTRSFGAGEGTLVSGSFTWYWNNHTQLFLIASHGRGGDRSDFGRLIRASVQTGVRFTL